VLKYKIGKIYNFQQKSYLEKEPALIADRHTEVSGVFVGSVLKDGGVYRMWYTAWSKNYNGSDDMAIGGYVEFGNCVDWRKPDLGIVEFDGNKNNNLCNPGGAVFIDPSSNSYRYRACGYGRPKRSSSVKRFSGDGYYTFHSSDGFIWETDSDYPRWPGTAGGHSCTIPVEGMKLQLYLLPMDSGYMI